MNYKIVWNKTIDPISLLYGVDNDDLEYNLSPFNIGSKNLQITPFVSCGYPLDNLGLGISQNQKPNINCDQRPDRLIDIKEVCMLTGLCRSSVYDKQNRSHKNYDPTFPKRKTSKSLGSRARYSYNAIIKWISDVQS